MRKVSCLILVVCLCVVGCNTNLGGVGGGKVNAPAGDPIRPTGDGPDSGQPLLGPVTVFLSSTRSTLIRGDDRENRATLTARSSTPAAFAWDVDAPAGLLSVGTAQEIFTVNTNGERIVTGSRLELTATGDPGPTGRRVTITATATDAAGISDNQSLSITVVRPEGSLAATISAAKTRVPPGKSVELTANISAGNPFTDDSPTNRASCERPGAVVPPDENPPYCINWTFNSIALGAEGLGELTADNLTEGDAVTASLVTYRAPVAFGPVIFTAEVWDAAGNRVTETITVTVAPDAQLSVISSSESTTVAPGKAVTLTANGEGGESPYDITFRTSENMGAQLVLGPCPDDISTLTGSAQVTCTGEETCEVCYIAPPDEAGSESVTVEIEDQLGDTTSTTIPLIVASPENLSVTMASAQGPSVKPGSTSQMTATIIGGTPPYTVCFGSDEGTLGGGDTGCGPIKGQGGAKDLTNCTCNAGDPATDGLDLVEVARTYTAPPQQKIDSIVVRVLDAVGAKATDSFSLEIVSSGSGGSGGTGTISLAPEIINTNGTTSTPCLGQNVTINANPTGGSGGNQFIWEVVGGTLLASEEEALVEMGGSAEYTAPQSTALTRTIRVTVTEQGGSTDSKDVNITVSPDPDAMIFADPVCPNSTGNTAAVLYAGLGATYDWTVDGTPVSTNGVNTITFDAGAIGPVALEVTVTNAHGCWSSGTKDVTVNANPDATITTDAAVCAGATGNSASVPNAGTGAVYEWTIVGGTIENGQGARLITYAAGTGATVELTVEITSGFGCEATGNTLVTVNPAPDATITADASVCANSMGNTAEVPDAGLGASYFWSVNGGAIIGSNTLPTVTYAAGPGPSLLLDVTVTSANGCEVNAVDVVVTVEPNPTPIISASPAEAVCDGATVTLDAGVYPSYLWSTGETTQTIDVTTGGTYSVTVTSANGCQGVDNILITVSSALQPTIVAIPGETVCDGTSVTLDAGGGYQSYLWSTGAITRQISVTTSGTYSVTVTDINGCEGTDDIDITVNPNPTPSILATPGATVCEGTTVTLDAGAGHSSYSWSTGATTQTINVTTSAIYSVTVMNAGGCTGSDSITITVNPNPTPTIVASPGVTVCDGTIVTLDAGAGHSSYLWSTGETTRTIEVTTTGTYDVTVTDAGGCTGNDSIDISVNPNLMPTITATPGADVCDGTTVTLDAGPFSTYLWAPGGQTTRTIAVTTGGTYSVTVTDATGCDGNDSIDITVNANPVPAIIAAPGTEVCDGTTVTLDAGAGFTSYLWAPGGQTTQTIDVTASGHYRVTVANAGGCEGSDDVDVTVNANPVPGILAIPGTTVCEGTTVTLNAGAGFSSYLWAPGGQTTRTIGVTSTGTYSVTVTNAQSCTGNDSIDITVNANPTPGILATPGADVCEGTTVTLDAGAGYSSYSWSTGATTQTINVTTSAIYSVTVENANGCTGSDSMNVTVNPNPTPTITASPGVTVCDGTTVTLDAGAYADYLWSTGETTQTIDVITTGTYSVTVTNAGGCTGNDSIDISVNPNLMPTIIATPGAEVCDGTTVTLDAGPFSTYLWAPGGQTTRTISVTTAGTYSVTVTDATGCDGSDSIDITVNANPVP
ncbi:MAG: hypothetical protein KAV82_01755, partial [Phycisphaerae bacterium]|nr:hypothetical protein [Phycisphaerae bacterium]